MLIHADKRPIREHQRRYNAPEASEVPEIIPVVEYNLTADHRDIILQRCGVRNPKRNMVFSEINVSHR